MNSPTATECDARSSNSGIEIGCRIPIRSACKKVIQRLKQKLAQRRCRSWLPKITNFLSWLPVFALFPQQSMAVNFEVRGWVEVTPADEDGSLMSSEAKRSEFKVSVRDKQWLLESRTASGNYDIWGCDGDDTYSMEMHTNTPGAFCAMAVKGQYPLGANVIFITLPWLSFGSSYFLAPGRQSPIAYLADPARAFPMPTPWAFPYTDPAAFVYSTEVRRFEDQPRLPEEVTFRVSAPLLKSAADNPLLETGPLNAAVIAQNTAKLRAYKPGFVGGRYRVLASTNWNGLRLPLDAELTRYSVRQPEAQVPFEVYRLRCEAVSASHVESYLPKLPQNASVADRRFSDRKLGIDLLRYSVPDGQWRSEADPRLRTLFEERKARARSSSATGSAQRRTVFVPLGVGLAILALVAGIIPWLTQRRKRHSHSAPTPM